jgi:hypothetical protein
MTHETAEPVTVVIFRTDKYNGEPIAFFPELPFGRDQFMCACYAHIGQHSDAHPAYYRDRTTKPGDYSDLKRELEAIGYRLKVVKRWNRKYDAVRRSFWNESYKTAQTF